MMLPNYMQMRGLARGLGAVVRPWTLVGGEAGAPWRPNLPALEELVSTGTKVIAICNPNNPTGARFSESNLDAIVRIAARVGASIVATEIPRGRDGRCRDARIVGSIRPRNRHQRPVESVWLARPADRVGRRPAGRRRAVLGRARLHHDRSGSDQRSARARGADAVTPRTAARPHTRHRWRQLPGRPPLDRETRAEARTHSTRSRCDRDGPLPPPSELDRARRTPEDRTQRPDRSRRSFRDGRIPAHWIQDPIPHTSPERSNSWERCWTKSNEQALSRSTVSVQ